MGSTISNFDNQAFFYNVSKTTYQSFNIELYKLSGNEVTHVNTIKTPFMILPEAIDFLIDDANNLIMVRKRDGIVNEALVYNLTNENGTFYRFFGDIKAEEKEEFKQLNLIKADPTFVPMWDTGESSKNGFPFLALDIKNNEISKYLGVVIDKNGVQPLKNQNRVRLGGGTSFRPTNLYYESSKYLYVIGDERQSSGATSKTFAVFHDLTNGGQKQYLLSHPNEGNDPAIHFVTSGQTLNYVTELKYNKGYHFGRIQNGVYSSTLVERDLSYLENGIVADNIGTIWGREDNQLIGITTTNTFQEVTLPEEIHYSVKTDLLFDSQNNVIYVYLNRIGTDLIWRVQL